jgi:aspartyl-tRNA(Asn)/glutamyl-tRNA(Gln) amidotransferase subunit B
MLTANPAVADYFESTANAATGLTAKSAANWITVEIFAFMNQAGVSIEDIEVEPQQLAALIQMVNNGEINQNTAKTVLAEMLQTGEAAESIVEKRDLRQISDSGYITELVKRVLEENPEQVATYLKGKQGLSGWFFGQVMRATKGKADPQIVKKELERQLGKMEDHS